MSDRVIGKQALIDAATALFAERGVDAVSLSDINRASGHRNRSAATYHFGGKDDLVLAVVVQAIAEPDRRRVELLDQLEAVTDSPTVRQILEVMVTPMVEALSSEEGRRRLRLLANLATSEPYFSSTQELMWGTDGLRRCVAHLAAHLAWLPDPLMVERFLWTTGTALRAFSDQARLVDAVVPARQPLDTDSFATHIVDVLDAMINAPLTGLR